MAVGLLTHKNCKQYYTNQLLHELVNMVLFYTNYHKFAANFHEFTKKSIGKKKTLHERALQNGRHIPIKQNTLIRIFNIGITLTL